MPSHPWIISDEHTAGTGKDITSQLRDEGYADGEVAAILSDAIVDLVKDTPDPEAYLEDIIDLMRDALGG